jgi:hypothetical protein
MPLPTGRAASASPLQSAEHPWLYSLIPSQPPARRTIARTAIIVLEAAGAGLGAHGKGAPTRCPQGFGQGGKVAQKLARIAWIDDLLDGKCLRGAEW